MDKQAQQMFPKQHQGTQPGKEALMSPLPQFLNSEYKPSGKLNGKVAIVTGGDSGIGRSVAIHFAKEGANVAIVYLNEHEDAKLTEQHIIDAGQKCLSIPIDLSLPSSSMTIIDEVIKHYGQVDILVNNAAVQYPQNSILDITTEQLEKTFATNLFSYFYLTKATLPHLKQGSTIINTTSVTAYEGHKRLIDYSATKGAITTFTRSLALSLVEQKIRVNSVAPGPIWTPLIVSSFNEEEVSKFGSTTPLGRAGQPYELAPLYVFLACCDSDYITGQTFNINGGIPTL